MSPAGASPGVPQAPKGAEDASTNGLQAIRIDPTVKREIERAVTLALSRKGLGGNAVVNGNRIELQGVAPGVVDIDLGDWVSQWNLLPSEMRDRRAEVLAVGLTTALRDKAGSGSSSMDLGPLLVKIGGFVGVLAVLAAVVYWLDDAGFFGATVEPDASAATATSSASDSENSDEQLDARRQRTCDAARKRLYAGATMGVDVDGWVVELWLSRQAGESLADEQAVADIGSEGPGDVGAKGDTESEVVAAPNAGGVIVRMSEGFVPSFFDSVGRNKMIAMSQRVATAVKADHAALYARCAHLPVRDVGAWYFGRDAGAVVASMLYAAGAFADPAIVDVGKHGGQGKALESLARASSAMTQAELNEVLRLEGGRWIPLDPEAESGPTSIRFPLGGPTRAAKVTRTLASKLGL